MIDWWRIAAYGLAATLAMGSAAGWGYYQGSKKLWDYQAGQAREAVKVVVKQGAATERVVTRYVTLQAQAVIIEKTIEKEVIRYAESHPGLCLDHQWRSLHDGAAAGAIPDPATPADGAGEAPPTAAQALQTVTGNYANCRATARRLDHLQDWVQAQKDLNP